MHSRRNRIILLLNRYILQINSKVNCERRKILYCGSVVGLTAASYLGAYKWLSRNKPIPILLHAAQSENLLDNFRLSIENSRAIIDKAKILGFGFADVENRVPCSEHTVMRIASISKAITMTLAAQLFEAGALDWDQPVHKYISTWASGSKENSTKRRITPRLLTSHLSGIRHYDDSKETTPDDTQKRKSELKDEMYIKKHYDMERSLSLFKSDELCSTPGSEFLYTTHGFTLLSAVIEKAGNEAFQVLAKRLFEELGMVNTYLDEYNPIIMNRSRFYHKRKSGRLENAPYVDNSYKWAGGGFVSCVTDLLRFGNAMLYSLQADPSRKTLLRPDTVRMLWTPVPKAVFPKKPNLRYGMGWEILEVKDSAPYTQENIYAVMHTGGAIGASSILLIVPTQQTLPLVEKTNTATTPPCGIVVSILCNMEAVGLRQTALNIAKEFEKAQTSQTDTQ